MFYTTKSVSYISVNKPESKRKKIRKYCILAVTWVPVFCATILNFRLLMSIIDGMTTPSDQFYSPQLREDEEMMNNSNSEESFNESLNENKTTLFIALNCKDPSVVPIWWLQDCLPPLCMYQIFGDQFSNLSNTFVYPSRLIQGGYRNFGYRGRFQMEWAVSNFDFDWFLRVDEDGYLCIDSLLHTLYHESAPKKKVFLWKVLLPKRKSTC